MSIDRIKKLATTKGFNELWEKEVGKGKTHKEAFWAVEKEYRETFEENKYKNYHSFRNSRRYLLNN